MVSGAVELDLGEEGSSVPVLALRYIEGERAGGGGMRWGDRQEGTDHTLVAVHRTMVVINGGTSERLAAANMSPVRRGDISPPGYSSRTPLQNKASRMWGVYSAPMNKGGEGQISDAGRIGRWDTDLGWLPHREGDGSSGLTPHRFFFSSLLSLQVLYGPWALS